MPVAFERCIKKGGKVRTKKISKTKYMRICFIDGKSYNGHIKTKKVIKTKKKNKR